MSTRLMNIEILRKKRSYNIQSVFGYPMSKMLVKNDTILAHRYKFEKWRGQTSPHLLSSHTFHRGKNDRPATSIFLAATVQSWLRNILRTNNVTFKAKLDQSATLHKCQATCTYTVFSWFLSSHPLMMFHAGITSYLSLMDKEFLGNLHTVGQLFNLQIFQ